MALGVEERYFIKKDGEQGQMCAGCRVSGYWKGWDCGNEGVFDYDGRKYCHSHLAIAMNNPERFEKARKSKERKLSRNRK